MQRIQIKKARVENKNTGTSVTILAVQVCWKRKKATAVAKIK